MQKELKLHPKQGVQVISGAGYSSVCWWSKFGNQCVIEMVFESKLNLRALPIIILLSRYVISQVLDLVV